MSAHAFKLSGESETYWQYLTRIDWTAHNDYKTHDHFSYLFRFLTPAAYRI